jgi:hypothetical protein
MGTPEEVSRVAGGVIDALKTSPIMLGLMLINVMTLGFVMMALYVQAARWERMFDKALAVCPEKRNGSVMFQHLPHAALLKVPSQGE